MEQYGSKLVKTLLVSFACSFVSMILGFFVFEMSWTFLPAPLLSGVVISLVQNENRTYKLLDKLILGLAFYGFLTALFVFSRNFLISRLFYQTEFPFWPLYNPKETIIFSAILAYTAFIGGLTGILCKGFYSIYILKKL